MKSSSDTWNSEHYKKYASFQNHEWALVALFEHIKFKGDETILDVGCGNGTLTAKMALKVPRGNVYCIFFALIILSCSAMDKKNHSPEAETNMQITINDLKKFPQHIPRLIQIAREGLGLTWSPDEEQLRQSLHIDLLPLTLVALDNSMPVGMCSLSQAKGLRPDLTPWLGPLVVDKQYQRCGIGNQLIEAIKQKAHILGFKKLYLCTHDPELATRYYQQRGWNIIGVDEWKGHSVTVMEINLQG